MAVPIYREKARKRLKKARQMIDKESFAIKFVLLEDIRDQVIDEGVGDQAEVVGRAQRIWNEVCFPLDIYRTVEGWEGTQAEAMREWLQRGHSWEAAISFLQTLYFTTSPERAVSPSFRAEIVKRLRENTA